MVMNRELTPASIYRVNCRYTLFSDGFEGVSDADSR